MLSWIQNNSQLISVGVNAAMVLIWLVYLRLFIQTIRKNERSSILITRGGGQRASAHCMICNMSAQIVYVMSVTVTIRSDSGNSTHAITDVRRPSDTGKGGDVREHTHQGPLESGEMMDLGSFESVLERAYDSAGSGSLDLETGHYSVEILVMAHYSSENLPIAATRSFDIRPDGDDPLIVPTSPRTRQIRSNRERKRLWNTLRDELYAE
ncbi:hypothetical protein T8K17_19290 [Thalassobaculum sp. OXR-137]|uniref:hypothetical protein n=1 Tax=Thalassobaculum sp. OXR-137 TaxID=3100173 RepID=UPI002AC8958F|nr:hypothetical protein [Thalassobaculum sp. OXR-137]WPZ33368.1 hypothetical protein T8K17_19290 [Thalassobaculum sp. OXR-137]